MAILPRAGAAQRVGRRDGHLRRPGQHLLVGPIPSTLAIRIWLHRPTHGPLASHLSLPIGGSQLGPCSSVWTAPAAPAETSSGASATGGPNRTCHLRLGHLQAIVMGWPTPFSCGARLAGQPEGRELIRCRSQFWGSTWARTAAASWVWTPAGGWSCGDA